MNKQQACEWIDGNGGWIDGVSCYAFSNKFDEILPIENNDLFTQVMIDIFYPKETSKLTKPDYDQYLKDKADKMNARDETYTGKVSEWGLPDGTVMTNVDKGFDSHISCLVKDNLMYSYKIKSLPDGYEFNDDGEIVKVEVKRYWDGQDPLEVGMIVDFTDHEIPTGCEWAVSYTGKYRCVLENLDTGNEFWVNKNNIKPIDNRTDKQKAVDAFLESRTYAYDVRCALGEFYDYLNGGKDET